MTSEMAIKKLIIQKALGFFFVYLTPHPPEKKKGGSIIFETKAKMLIINNYSLNRGE